MFNINDKSIGSALPSIEGGVLGQAKGFAIGGGSPSFDWGKLLKVIIAVLTAIAGSLGLASCIS